MGDPNFAQTTISVKYSCHQCGVSKRIVEIPARTTQDVVQWLNEVMAPMLSRDHDSVSPGCIISKLDEVFIPISGTSKIGGAVEH